MQPTAGSSSSITRQGQRNDTGEIPQHSRETQEVAAACGQDVPGAGTTLRSQCSSDDAHLTASWREAGGCTSRADPLPCSWYSAPLRTFGSKRRICPTQGSMQLFSQLPDFDHLHLRCW
ncbi:protein lin-52 homolog isoform X2 [Eptesicus fuscus]|uniref:protein lin-52 homolog isoform X2 n=1 Tax=Eptesicus fuscus TaxID=29078 RepID=UPI002403C82C|nr:protein lin-52 homolog isoform X2 [Eptesicus fuscus]